TRNLLLRATALGANLQPDGCRSVAQRRHRPHLPRPCRRHPARHRRSRRRRELQRLGVGEALPDELRRRAEARRRARGRRARHQGEARARATRAARRRNRTAGTGAPRRHRGAVASADRPDRRPVGSREANPWRQEMSVTSVEKNMDALTMTVTADLDATVERAWQLWAEPRQFERWWGPPGCPPTVVDHDLRAGGRGTFFMTGTAGGREDSPWGGTPADPPPPPQLRG